MPATSKKAADPRFILSEIPSADGGFIIACLDAEVNRVDVLYGTSGDYELNDPALETITEGVTMGDALRLIAKKVDADLSEYPTQPNPAKVLPMRKKAPAKKATASKKAAPRKVSKAAASKATSRPAKMVKRAITKRAAPPRKSAGAIKKGR